MSSHLGTSHYRFLKVATAGSVLLVTAVVLYFCARWPFTAERISDSLGRATGCAVTASRVDLSFLRPGCTLRGVTFRSMQGARIATVDAVIVRSSWLNLLTLQKHRYR
jgi:hypothetical protein